MSPSTILPGVAAKALQEADVVDELGRPHDQPNASAPAAVAVICCTSGVGRRDRAGLLRLHRVVHGLR